MGESDPDQLSDSQLYKSLYDTSYKEDNLGWLTLVASTLILSFAPPTRFELAISGVTGQQGQPLPYEGILIISSPDWIWTSNPMCADMDSHQYKLRNYQSYFKTLLLNSAAFTFR